MKNQALTPTHARSHAPAKHLRQAGRSLKDLLTEEDLGFLVGVDEEPLHWAIAATQKNRDQDSFLRGLEIEEWDIPQFVESMLSVRFQEWLATKSIEWHQQMYAVLTPDTPFGAFGWSTLYQQDESQRLPIVRLSDGTYSTGDKCYFPSAATNGDPELPCVDPRVY